MRVFVAGGTGVLGLAVLPMLVQAGHDVVASSRSRAKIPELQSLGAEAAILDFFDRESVFTSIAEVRPDAVIHLLTDLSGGTSESNAKLRTVGTRNLVDASRNAGVKLMVAESISWVYRSGVTLATEKDDLDLNAPEPRRTTVTAVKNLEEAILELPAGVVLRLGKLYGPGTWYSSSGRFGYYARAGTLPMAPSVDTFIHVLDAAKAFVLALNWEGGVFNVVDDEAASSFEWAPVFSEAVDATPDLTFSLKKVTSIVDAPNASADTSSDIGRPISNERAKKQGLTLTFQSWRQGFFAD